jgi:hypothetical protein
MQVQDFVKAYQAKSDEELIQLAVAPEQLAAEARLALEGEMSRRAISIADSSDASQHDGDGRDVRRSTPSERLQLGDGKNESVGDFVAEVLRTYRSHFWLFFKITAPAVIITTIAIISARNEVREISRHLPRGIELLAHKTEMLKIGLINYSAWILSWIVFSFVFGATCIAVEESVAGFNASAWRSFLNLRERLGPFLRLSLLLLFLVVVTGAASVLLAIGMFWVLHQWRVHPTGLLIWVVSYGLAGLAILVVSRFFLAVPAVILDDCRVVQALLRSDKLTQGKWLTLAALLAKSLIGGYVAGMSPYWAASFVHATAPLPSWFPWILTIASMIAVNVVEPTMFVGFALLYLKMSALDSSPSKYSPVSIDEKSRLHSLTSVRGSE